MNIGILLPSIYTSQRYGEGRIFAPANLAIELADQLVHRGHDVTVYSSRSIQTQARLIAGDDALTDGDLTYFQFRNREKVEQQYSVLEMIKRDFEYDLTMQAYQDATAGKLDIVHSFHDFGAHYFNELTGFPTVYTLHDPLPRRNDTIEYHRLKKFLSHNYISISNAQRNGITPLSFVATVYNGIVLSDYDFEPNPKDHLIHFGRIMEDKGTDIAIEAVRRAGSKLTIATSQIRGNRSQAYFDSKIGPEIDGTVIQLVGFLKGKDKSAYIGSGKAFLFPLRWDEPFGLVMTEAMACGTPVIAYNHGSVPEIVKDGVTGFIVDDDDANTTNTTNPTNTTNNQGKWIIKKRGIEGLVEAIRRIDQIDRAVCRRHVEENFTVEKMVDGYLKVYQKVLQRS